MKKIDPFKDLVLDQYEQELERSLPDELPHQKAAFLVKKAVHEAAAQEHVKERKTKRITLRVKETDIVKIKAKAERKAIPYQTVISSLIHQYAEGEVTLEI